MADRRLAAKQNGSMAAEEARSTLDMIKAGYLDTRERLIDFRDRRGWEALGYTSFKGCIEAEMGMSQSRIYQLIKADSVSDKIGKESTIVDSLTDDTLGGIGKELPVPKEAHARELAKLEDETEQVAAWSEAVGRAEREGVRLTAPLVRECVKVRLPEPDEPPPLPTGTTDGGLTVTDKVRGILLDAQPLRDIAKQIASLRREVKALAGEKYAKHLRFQTLETDLKNAQRTLEWGTPHGPCLWCNQRGCKPCARQGWLPKGLYIEAEREAKNA